MSERTVHDRPDRQRFEIEVEGRVAGHAEYERDGDVWTFTHTEVDDEWEGQGVGGALARGALDEVRRAGGRVVARCPFIAGWIDKHPDHADLLVDR